MSNPQHTAEPSALPDLSVVVPVYNEVENVPHLCEALHRAMSDLRRPYEILLVDDGSTDGSWDRLKEAATTYPGFRLIRFRRNFGQTAAIAAGFRESHGRLLVTMDADLQNDPADVAALLSRMEEGHDVVSGWRKERHDPFLTRRLPSMLANALISRITGVALHDYGCTLKVYRREVVDKLNLYGEMHRFIPALASWVGGSIAEVTVNHRARKYGTSKYGLARTLRVVLDLITVKFLTRYSMHPIQMFGKVGFLFGIPGILILVWVVLAHLSHQAFGTEFSSTLIKRPFWLITPFMLIIFCMQFISMGLLAEIQIRTYHESQSKPTYVIRETFESPRAEN